MDVYFTTVSELLARTGGSELPPRQAVESNYRHILRTGFFRVAELDGRIVSICGAIVRDDLWYLASFWTLPGFQRRKIGGPLLDMIWDLGRRAGARTFFTWSSSDLAAMASYMRKGMLPGCQILKFKGAPRDLPPAPSNCEVEPLDISTAMEMDRDVRGASREPDHAFWLGMDDVSGREVRRGDELMGYYYISKSVVGPMAWNDSRHAKNMLSLAFHDALKNGSAEIVFCVPGMNHDALRFALGAGLRLTGYSHLLATGPFGRMETYVPSGAALF